MNREMAGTIAGFVATAPMTAAMMALHSALPSKDQHPLPPRHIVENAAATTGVDLGPDEETHESVTLAAHFAYGATVGALYGPVAGATGLPRVAEGMLFGVAVWGGSYLGVLPGAGLYRSATDEAPARNALMIAAHLIWGASLGVLVATLAKDE
jgi:hypothetical protein